MSLCALFFFFLLLLSPPPLPHLFLFLSSILPSPFPALQLNYYSQYTAFNTQTMTFNKSEFAKSTSCNATIPLWARFAMEEDPAMR